MEAVGELPAELDIEDEPRLHAALEEVRRLTEPRQAAAALALSVARAQAFHDGNKRTATLAAAVLLEINRLRFTGDWMTFARILETGATASAMETDAVAAQLQDHLVDSTVGLET
jgi:prophage maintenance system killer protein